MEKINVIIGLTVYSLSKEDVEQLSHFFNISWKELKPQPLFNESPKMPAPVNFETPIIRLQR
jgi:hypothetical protein